MEQLQRQRSISVDSIPFPNSIHGSIDEQQSLDNIVNSHGSVQEGTLVPLTTTQQIVLQHLIATAATAITASESFQPTEKTMDTTLTDHEFRVDVPPAGVEPATLGLLDPRSNRLSYGG
ncbi:Golgin subfamily B member [Dirofilaria immitis]